jgi:hypothetical protein
VAVPYYDLTKVKLDLDIADTGNDVQLAHWNDEAEAEIDDMLYDKATKARRITSLPVLPFTSGSVPETVQGAADNIVASKYYRYVKDREMAKDHASEADKKLNRYINRLTVEREIYGRIV